jgi:putative hydrolase of the HAD superfamily
LDTWPKQIHNLLLDFGGTLDVAGAHWLDRFLRHYRAEGISLSREELDPAFAYATRRGYQAGERIYGFGLRALLNELVNWQLDYLLEHLPARVPASIRDRGPAIARRFCAESAVGYAQSRAALALLEPRFAVAVVSNFYGDLEAVLDEAGLLPFASAVIDSSRIGAFKPDPAIYEQALAALHARPEETAMVGDSQSKDCAPARALGLTTVWLRPATTSYTHRDGSVADFVVRDLHELVEVCRGAD